jgi:ubiquinone/menaquinone biosynthesis C-methylase UbiE
MLLPGSLSRQQHSQARYFDTEFGRYGQYAPENWRRSFIARIFRALAIRAGGGPYLDVGVGGSGATVIEAARLGVEATGCDLSISGVLHASRLARAEGVAARAHFVVCTAESLPFADGRSVARVSLPRSNTSTMTRPPRASSDESCARAASSG